jgi:K+ transporter
VQELYFSALVYVTVAFLQAEEQRKKGMIPMIAALLENFENDPIETGKNLYAAGFFAGALLFGAAVGSPMVLPVVSCVSALLGIATFMDNHRR